jgi:hypothetical protein
MTLINHLPCPNCQSPIQIDPRLLASGASVICLNKDCCAKIGIARSSLATVIDALSSHQRFDKAHRSNKPGDNTTPDHF